MTGRAVVARAEGFAWRLRGHLYRRVRHSGAVPTRAELGNQVDTTDTEVDDALRFLAEMHVLVLDEHGEVLMAHPFSAVPTPYRVETATRAYWANCAWDAIAIPLLLDTDGRTPTICPGSGERFEVTVTGGHLHPAGAVVRFAVPVRDFWDDIGFT
ncbi:MAG: organomercurial lyase [Gemmatimonadota bacterium]|nr:organomercurial lyase [Gemmatimonadota bacterium]